MWIAADELVLEMSEEEAEKQLQALDAKVAGEGILFNGIGNISHTFSLYAWLSETQFPYHIS